MTDEEYREVVRKINTTNDGKQLTRCFYLAINFTNLSEPCFVNAPVVTCGSSNLSKVRKIHKIPENAFTYVKRMSRYEFHCIQLSPLLLCNFNKLLTWVNKFNLTVISLALTKILCWIWDNMAWITDTLFYRASLSVLFAKVHLNSYQWEHCRAKNNQVKWHTSVVCKVGLSLHSVTEMVTPDGLRLVRWK